MYVKTWSVLNNNFDPFKDEWKAALFNDPIRTAQ